MSDMQKKIDSISSYNTAYWRMRPFWTDAINLYEPLPDTMGQYLFRYSSEDDQDFAERLKRLAQINFVEYVVQFWCSILFSTSVKIGSKAYQDRVDAFVKSCNKQGDTLMEYFRDEVAPASFLYGLTDVFVDLPPKPAGDVSMQQADELGIRRPYCYMVPPLNRVYWKLDENKNYSEYRSSDVQNTQIGSNMQIKDALQYTYWTLDRVAKYDEQGAMLGAPTPNPFGCIPAVTVQHRNSQRFYFDRIGVSLVKDVIPLQKLLLNLISLIFDFHEQTNFAHRVIIQSTKDGAESLAPVEGEQKEASSKKGMILYGEGSDLKIVTPDPAGINSMQELLGQMVQMVFLSCGLPSDINANKTHQSEGSVRSNRAYLYNAMTRVARQFEKSIRKIVEMALRVQGIDPEEAGVTVEWDCNFSYEAFLSALEELKTLRDVVQDISPTAVKAYAEMSVFPKVYNSPYIDDIRKEFADWKPEATEYNPDAPVPDPAVDKNAKAADADENAPPST